MNDDHSDVESPKLTLEEMLMLAESELVRMKTPTFGYATVLESQDKVNPNAYEPNDHVYCVDEGRVGRVAPQRVDGEGFVTVLFSDFSTGKYAIGLNDERPEVQLLGKNDGTNVVILYEGERFEVNGVFGVKFEPGQSVKINTGSKQIVSDDNANPPPGEICTIKKVLDDNYSEVEHHGQNRVVFNGKSRGKIKINERVQVDHKGFVILRTLGKENEDDYTCATDDLNVTWEDIGGCEEAKLALRQALEYPLLYPKLYSFYKRKPSKGVLLYGPTGCGKTMLIRAAAVSVAKAHGKVATKTGLIMVKGPELLSKWVGTTEERIRGLFRRGRDHFREHKYPPLLVIDEAEALLQTRGTGRSSDVNLTIVPQFLSEMDGVEDSPVMVVLLTNRPDMIDPAAVRPGRIDRHIKVPRPTQGTAKDIFGLHLRSVPLYNADPEEVVDLCIEHVFQKQKVLYRVRSRQATKPLFFTLADCLNGAMIKAIIDIAVDIALEKDRISQGEPKGVGTDDFVAAVQKQYEEQIDQNHRFDLEDFFETHSLQPSDVQIEKLRANGAA